MPTVLSIGFSLARVGGDATGGAEQVLASVEAGLVGRGWRSVVVAPRGSRIRGVLMPSELPDAPFDAQGRAAALASVRRATARALDEGPVDLVHMHGLDFAACLPDPGLPVLVTLHLPLDWYDAGALQPGRPATFLAAVSADQARRAAHGVAIAAVVENGVPVERLGPAPGRGGFVMALGRVCPEKGFHLALDAAKRCDLPMVLAGEVHPYPEHQAYFEAEIAPRIDSARRWIGPVGFAAKRRLLAAARCLLVPSLCDETSSLVAMEALACGTPVVAFRRGALPEIVEHGLTGFIVEGVEGLVRGIRDAPSIAAATCRAEAERRFSAAAMVDRYVALYRRMLDGQPVGGGPPGEAAAGSPARDAALTC